MHRAGHLRTQPGGGVRWEHSASANPTSRTTWPHGAPPPLGPPPSTATLSWDCPPPARRWPYAALCVAKDPPRRASVVPTAAPPPGPLHRGSLRSCSTWGGGGGAPGVWCLGSQSSAQAVMCPTHSSGLHRAVISVGMGQPKAAAAAAGLGGGVTVCITARGGCPRKGSQGCSSVGPRLSCGAPHCPKTCRQKPAILTWGSPTS